MKKLLLLLLLLTCLSSYSQTKIGNIEFPDKLQIKEHQLNLQGAGIRVKLWMDMYAMALYISQNRSEAKDIINENESMGIRLEIISSLISSKKMEAATREGFKKATNGEMENIKEEIETFISVFKEGIEKKDVFEFIYAPELGTKVYKNRKLKEVIAGLEFKQALFGIWLCDNPVDKNLKKKLLNYH